MSYGQGSQIMDSLAGRGPEGFEASLVAKANKDPTHGMGDVALLRSGMNLYDGDPRSRRGIKDQLVGGLEALKSNRYILFRNRARGDYCCRVTPSSMCYCGHTLSVHQSPWQDGRVLKEQKGEEKLSPEQVYSPRSGRSSPQRTRDPFPPLARQHAKKGGGSGDSVPGGTGSQVSSPRLRRASSMNDRPWRIQSAGPTRPLRAQSERTLPLSGNPSVPGRVRPGSAQHSQPSIGSGNAAGRTRSRSASTGQVRPRLTVADVALQLRPGLLSSSGRVPQRPRSVSMHIGHETAIPRDIERTLVTRPKSAVQSSLGSNVRPARPASSHWSKVQAAMRLVSVRFPDRRKVLPEEDDGVYERTGLDEKVDLSCAQSGCGCERFAFIPSLPEQLSMAHDVESLERKGVKWSAWCKCGHSHMRHKVGKSTSCQDPKCVGCPRYRSAWLCVACDKKWEEHVTVVETGKERRAAGRPCNIHFLPFSYNRKLQKAILDDELKQFGRTRYGHLIADPLARALSSAGARPVNSLLVQRGLEKGMHEGGEDEFLEEGEDAVLQGV